MFLCLSFVVWRVICHESIGAKSVVSWSYVQFVGEYVPCFYSHPVVRSANYTFLLQDSKKQGTHSPTHCTLWNRRTCILDLNGVLGSMRKNSVILNARVCGSQMLVNLVSCSPTKHPVRYYFSSNYKFIRGAIKSCWT